MKGFHIILFVLAASLVMNFTRIVGSFRVGPELSAALALGLPKVWNYSLMEDAPTTRRHKIILIGPHDRYNFGDLLFEKVASRLLVDVAKYQETDLISTGLRTTDMSKYGGNPNIVDVATAVEESRSSPDGPFNVIYLGGEAMGCTVECGARMMPDEETRQRVLQRSTYQSKDCAYLFPKELLVGNSGMGNQTGMGPVAIVNSLGGANGGRPGCIDAVRSADFVAFRDMPLTRPFPWTKKFEITASARPDSAVMTHRLFSDTTREFGSKGEVAMIRQKTNDRYLAIQFKKDPMEIENIQKVAETFDHLFNLTGLEAVFFLAGSVFGHDSVDLYRDTASHMTTPCHIFETEHVWAVVSLIRYASAVISTSLHVRIMSFVHARPRVLVNEKSKHSSFVDVWESEDAKDTLFPRTELWDPIKLPTILLKQLATPPNKTYEAQDRAIEMYLEGFKQWSSKLESTWNSTLNQ